MGACHSRELPLGFPRSTYEQGVYTFYLRELAVYLKRFEGESANVLLNQLPYCCNYEYWVERQNSVWVEKRNRVVRCRGQMLRIKDHITMEAIPASYRISLTRGQFEDLARIR